MTKLNVVASVSAGLIKVMLDERTFLSRSGQRTEELPEGEKFVLTWVINGEPFGSYSIDVDSPANATVSIKKTLSASGKDFGGFTFRT